jgi:beta-lactamase class A
MTAGRRRLLLALAALPALPVIASADPAAADDGFTALEGDLDGELGVAAIDTGSGRTVLHRADQRFAMCSTFKTVLAAAILARAGRTPGLLDQSVPLPKDVFVAWSPVTGEHEGGALTVRELCAAALQHSDNTAANALLREVGGPAGLTQFARTLGDDAFRLDRWETALNAAVPGDERDTTTPLAMARTLQRLLLGDALPPQGRQQLRDWMLGNTTGAGRIRAAAPAGWQVADKTGSGDYGCTNDVAVLYPPGRAPIVLAVYSRQRVRDAQGRSDVVAAAARMALAAFDR